MIEREFSLILVGPFTGLAALPMIVGMLYPTEARLNRDRAPAVVT
jgi:hypothetical protein